MEKIDTTNWVEIPFTVDGIKFKSVLNPKGGIYKQISRIPLPVFENMNIGAIHNLMHSNVSQMQTFEIKARLQELNEGASEALICLA